MKNHPVANTLRLPCQADDYRVMTSEDQLAECLVDADRRAIPVTLLGDASNLVLRPRLAGIVLRLRLRGTSVQRLGRERWRVNASAGETWQEVVRATLGQGIGGLENLTLIPGTVGAAPVQNIGAYGRELAEVVEAVRVFDRVCQTYRSLSVAACRFHYRDSCFKRDAADRYVIVGVSMLLGSLPPTATYPDVRRELAGMGRDHVGEAARVGMAASRQTIAEAVARVRRRKLPDPRSLGNVGSFFKNPALTARQLDAVRSRLDIAAHPLGAKFKVPAARLIDSAGWKGVRFGAVQVWPRQPLVLVNHGAAACDDVLDVAERIRDSVAEKYGVRLDLEPAVRGAASARPGWAKPGGAVS